MNPLPQTGSLFRPWELRRDDTRNDGEDINFHCLLAHQNNCFASKAQPKSPGSRSESDDADSKELRANELTSPKYSTNVLERRHSEERNFNLHQKMKHIIGADEQPIKNKRPASSLTKAPHSSKLSLSNLESRLPLSDMCRKKRPKDKACSKCHNTFSNQAQLDAHMRGHFNVRNYGCEYIVESSTKRKCGKRFVRKEELTRHQRTHTGEKPHVCRICTKGFGRKDHLQKHEKTHERSQQSQFQIPPFNLPFPPPATTAFPLMTPPARSDLLLCQPNLLLHSLNLFSYAQVRHLQVDAEPAHASKLHHQSLDHMKIFTGLSHSRDFHNIVQPRTHYTS